IASLSHYYFLIMIANHVTDNFDHQSFRNIPLVPDLQKEGQLNLTRLREAVQSQGRLRDARLVLSFEVGFHPDEVAKQHAFRQPVPLDQNRAHLTVWLDQMKATKYPNCRESFAAWIEFSERETVKTDSMMLSNALGKIADAALEILQASPSVENKAIFWEWELRNESLLEQSGDVYFLYMSKLFTGQSALSLFDELGAVLRWQEEFQGRYPDFHLWALLVAGKRTLAQVYLRLEQQDQVIKTFSEISEILRQRDDFWTEDADEGGQYAPQNVSNLDPVGQNSTTSEEMPAFKAENLREEWFSEWVNTAQIGFGKEFKDFSVALSPQLARGADPYMTTLLRWLKAAVNDGTITETELECIIMDSKAGLDAQGHDAVEAVQELVPSTLRVHLYGLDSQLVFSARWASIFRLLQDWLLHRAGYNETKRHVLLGQLQTERLDSLIPTPRNSEILQEAERMLDL
ncbi:MAG: hypothetical protein LQ341_007149, partial [Variospora aurantia]